MPIKTENKRRYPPNWRQIRAAILDRSGNRCEQCGVPNYAYRPRKRDVWTDDLGQAETWAMDGERVSRIVLTIAHLDHTPENCDPTNLRAWCQRCHLKYDAEHHYQNARRSRRSTNEKQELFGWV